MGEDVADRLLERLREWGIAQVFGYPGDGINGLLAAWGRAGDHPQFVQAGHEEMAAFGRFERTLAGLTALGAVVTTAGIYRRGGAETNRSGAPHN